MLTFFPSTLLLFSFPFFHFFSLFFYSWRVFDLSMYLFLSVTFISVYFYLLFLLRYSRFMRLAFYSLQREFNHFICTHVILPLLLFCYLPFHFQLSLFPFLFLLFCLSPFILVSILSMYSYVIICVNKLLLTVIFVHSYLKTANHYSIFFPLFFYIYIQNTAFYIHSFHSFLYLLSFSLLFKN